MESRSYILYIAVVVSSLLLSFASCDSGSRRVAMIAVLEEVDSLNRNYIPITSDSLLQEAAEYFDIYGTPNERLRAYYLLGCAYRDMGEAPRAIEAWQNAIACADTAATDCDYSRLCRVCSQMAEIFYQQNLINENLNYLDQSIRYANYAHDTLAAINSYAYKIGSYDRMDMLDSVVEICDYVYIQLSQMGYESLASQYACMGVHALLTLNQIDKAKFYLDCYEAHSGYFDEEQNIIEGREVYYNLKGRYFQALHQYDSAKYYYQKELHLGKDYMNQNLASYGLAHIYSVSHLPDSAAKYALYSYAMNDSVYAQMATQDVENANSLYSYARYQQLALQEKEKAEEARHHIRLLIYIIISSVILVAWVANKIRKKRRDEEEKHLQLLNELEKTQTEILLLRSQEAELDAVIKEKEANVESMRQELALYRQKAGIEKENVELRLARSQAYTILTKKVSGGFCLTDEEWKELHKLVIEVLPQFYSFISAKEHALIPKEYRTCILLRLHVPPLSISVFLGVNPSYVTKLSKQILRKLFNKEGTSKDLSRLLSDIC